MKRALRILLAVVAAAVLAAAGGITWLLGTESGLRWALARASAATEGRLVIEEARGTLGAGVTAKRIAYSGDTWRAEARGVEARAHVWPLLRGDVGVEPLRIASLRVELRPAKSTPSAAPAPVPVGVRIGALRVGRLDLDYPGGAQVFEQLQFAYVVVSSRRFAASGAGDWPNEPFAVRSRLELEGSLRRFEAKLEGTVGAVPAQVRFSIESDQDRPVRALEARVGPADPSTWRKDLPHASLTAVLQARAAHEGYGGELSLENAAPATLDSGGVPVQALRTRFDSHGFEQATLTGLRADVAGGGAFEGRGTLDAKGLRAALQAQDLNLRAWRSDLRRTHLAGPLALDLSPEQQAVQGRLSEGDLSVEADVTRKADTVDVQGLHVQAAGGEARGSARLRIAKHIGVQAKLRFSRFDPSAFGDYPQGSLNGALDAEGLLGEAPRADARWTLERSTLAGRSLASRGEARFERDRVSRLRAQAHYGGARLEASGAFGRAGDALALHLATDRAEEFVPELHGPLQADGTLRGTWAQPALKARASLRALRLPGDDRDRALRADFDGTVSRHEIALGLDAPGARFRAQLLGGWSGARGWQGEITSLENAGTYPTQLISPAALAIARDRVVLGRFEAKVDAGRLRVEEVRWTPGRVTTHGEVRGLPAVWVALAVGGADHVRTTMLLDADWQIDAAPVPVGYLRVRRASGELALRGEGEDLPLEISAAELDARFAGRGATLSARARSKFGELSVEGQVGLAPGLAEPGYGRASPLDLRVRFQAAGLRALAQPYVTQARIDGSLSAQATLTGTLTEARVEGSLRGEGLGFEIPAYGVYLKDGRLEALLQGDRIRVASLSVRGGEGEFQASGDLPLRLAGGGARLAWTARRLEVLNRHDLRLTVSGQGVASYDGKRVLLAGELRADRGYVLVTDDSLPRPGEDVVVVGEAPKPSAAGSRVPLALDVRLDLGQDLKIDTQTLEGKLAGQVRVMTADDGKLIAHGRLNAVNAVFSAYGQRLVVDPGELVFDGPLDNPGLNITAWRRNQAVEAGVQVTGNLKAPRVVLVSSPPVSQQEQLSWLVLGRAPGEASRADLGLLQAAASSLLARGSSLPADRRLARAVGIDEISLRGGGDLQGGVVAVGKRLSDRLYVSYEQGLGAVATSVVKLDYSLGRRWSLRGEAGTASSAGLFYRFAWD
ncbi:MAG TPA: translocation/assembly module TamB domain-containing protein [Burkholderiales bacterium]|nr:translocation/assembly module TamB domain-containing protein [Burkholderiales bacterium]